MRHYLKITIFYFLTCSFCIEEIDFLIENEILVLTETNFDKALDKYEHLFIMFYSPFCVNCEKFKSELENAAIILRNDNLFVAKVDVTVEKNIANKYRIKEYPTIKFFINGSPYDYDGDRKAEDIIKWVRRKSSPPTRPLNTFENFEKFKKENPVCIIYYGNNSEEKKIFTNVAIKMEDYPFAYVENKEIIEKAKEKMGSIVLYKNFDEKRNEINNFDEKLLIEFIESKTQKKVSFFDNKTLEIVFGKNHPGIIYFGEKGKLWDEAKELIEEIADKAIEKNLKVIMTEIKKGIGKRIVEYIGLKIKELPSLIIIDTRQKEIKKYILDKEINKQNILEFIEGWEKGILKRHLKTQEEPKRKKGPILELVGKTFKREVLDNDKDIMVIFYTPWCTNCKNLFSEYEKAANKLKENHKIILAKMDVTENEVEGINFIGFPTIKFWPGNRKDKEPINYLLKKSAEGIIEYLKYNCFNKPVLVGEKSGEL